MQEELGSAQTGRALPLHPGGLRPAPARGRSLPLDPAFRFASCAVSLC